jgi:branched-chain amino acid transport system permease protein
VTTFLVYLIIGITVGGVYAIAATGLVVTYKTSRIFNFAYGSTGVVVAFIYYQMRVVWGWPSYIALAVSVLLIAPAIGILLDRLLMRHLQQASIAVKLVATLALSLLIQGIALCIWGSTLRTMPTLFSASTFSPLHGLNISYNQAGTTLIALAVAGGMWYLLHRTRLGVTMRAVVDDTDLGELNGIDPRRITGFSWALGTSLAGLAAILVAPQLTLSIQSLSVIVVTAYAAAIIGRLTSVAWTFAGGLLLGILSALLTGYLPPANEFLSDLAQAAPFAIMFAMLVIFRRETNALERADFIDVGSPPPLRTTLLVAGAGVGLSFVVGPNLTNFYAYVVATALIYALVLLSLVLITGVSGQISLAQFSFVGIGAVLMGHLSQSMPYLLALIVAVLLTAIIGAVIALPALRLRGLYLALATFAFAVMMDQVVFPNSAVIPDATQTLAVPSPSIFGLHLQSASSQIPLLTLLVGAVGVGILVIRRGRSGRSLTALRDAPVAASSLGMNLVRTRVLVFAAASGIAGMAGCFFGGIQGSVSATEFTYPLSLDALLILAIQGVSSVAGAIVGAAFYGIAFLVLPQWITNQGLLQVLQPLLIGLGVLNLAIAPGGAIAQQRKQLATIRSRFHRLPQISSEALAGARRG